MEEALQIASYASKNQCYPILPEDEQVIITFVKEVKAEVITHFLKKAVGEDVSIYIA